jgi:spore germination protein YaaH
MRNRRRALLLALGAGCCLLPPIALAVDSSEPESARKIQTWGYYPTWLEDTWKNLGLTLWDRVILFELPVGADGRIKLGDGWSGHWQPMLNAVRRAGGGFDIALTLLDEANFRRLFSRPDAVERLLQDAVRLIHLPGFNGIHLDFEVYGAMEDQAVSAYRVLIERLYREMITLDDKPVLSVFFPVGGAKELFDSRTLHHVDYVVVQGYDAHSATSVTAGPVSPLTGKHALTWEKSLRYVLNMDVPRSKILFSIPYFGYEWPVESASPGARTTGRGVTTTYAPVDAQLLPLIRVSVTDRIARYPVKRDPDSRSPYYAYQADDGQWYQGWYEDEASLREKFNFIIAERLAGIAAFPLGYDAGVFDRTLAQKFGPRG